jgi:proteasome lid subunit RPN8/RPN11
LLPARDATHEPAGERAVRVPRPLRLTPLFGVAATGLVSLLGATPPVRPRPAAVPVVVLTAEVRSAIDSIFHASNRHWDELAESNTLDQMLGSGRPTQLEYMGCLQGRASGDTIWVHSTVPAAEMKRFQFAVTGECDHLPDLVGTWHTHPYRASLEGKALKERVLSSTDLATFSKGADRAVLAVWDADSIDVAVRMMDGAGCAATRPR